MQNTPIKTYSDISPKWPHAIAKIAGACAIITGFLVILGYIFYLWMPGYISAFLITMKPNSAVCFLLIGIAIWLSCETKTRIKSIIIEGCSAVVILIAFLTLFQYFFNINFGIDEFLFKVPDNLEISIHDNRMSPITAVNFALIGFTLFSLEMKLMSYKAQQLFILAIFIIAFFEFLNHIYKIGYSSSIGHSEINILQINFLDSTLFILISIGMLSIRPTQGVMSIIISRNNGGKLARRLTPPAIILPVLLGYIGIFQNSAGSYEISYLTSIFVLATTLLYTSLILINSYLVEKADQQRKQSMQNLKHSQALALKSAEAGTWNWNIQHNVLVLDNYLHYLFGITVGKFPGYFEAIYKFIHPKDRERFHNEIQECLKKDFEYESEFRVIRPDGSIHTLASRGHIYRDETGKALHMSGISWDITHRKQVEEELRHAKDIAENLADRAEEANRAKSTFLTAMSHEIRTPLNGVLGMLSLLYDTPLTTEQREHIETARLSGEELLSVINDILDFSKIESGRMELEIMDFNLQNLVDDTVEMHASQVQHKRLAMGAVIESNVPPWLTGDPGRVRQVLSNLLGNATKFTDKGEISIRVKLAAQDENQVVLLFQVIDTGIGIAPETVNRIFKPFSQGDISASRKHGGTGLGLAISKRLVEMMGGEIHVKSAAGKGSKFWFTVKLIASAPPISEIKQEIQPELRNSRILCVDDNEINREIIKRQIEFLGLHCDLASNAGEALSILKKAVFDEAPYDLALIDCVMPGMDGIEMIQVMRRLKEIQNTPVIILSSSEASFGLNEMKNLNILMSLNKPLRQNKLHESVITALQIIYGTESKIKPTANTQEIKKKKIRILLVEDNFVNQQVALGVLNKLGYLTTAVINGFEALEAYKQNQYDLILMDCQMPEMDGYTATQEIRKLEQQQKKNHVVIIAMTAHALKGDREKCIRAGMDDYISKPIDIKLLASILQRWLFNQEKTKIVDLPSSKEQSINTPSMIDMQRIHEIFGDDNSAIKQFLQSLAESTELLFNQLQPVIANQDEISAKDLFHQLKGSCGNSGISTMQKLSMDAEEKVKQQDWNSVNILYDLLAEEFKKLQAEIELLNS